MDEDGGTDGRKDRTYIPPLLAGIILIDHVSGYIFVPMVKCSYTLKLISFAQLSTNERPGELHVRQIKLERIHFRSCHLCSDGFVP